MSREYRDGAHSAQNAPSTMRRTDAVRESLQQSSGVGWRLHSPIRPENAKREIARGFQRRIGVVESARTIIALTYALT